MSAREPGPDADAPQEPESAGPTGLDGARRATERGIDAEPDPATAPAEHPETSSAAACQRLSAEETTPTVTAIRSDSAPASSVPTSAQDRPRGSRERTRIFAAAGSIIVVAEIGRASCRERVCHNV